MRRYHGEEVRKMQPALAKALTAPVDLEWLIGCEHRVLDEARLRSNVSRILSWRRYPDDYEAHFTMFNALTGVPYYQPSADLLDWIDAQLADYILTCKSDSEAQANFMLCDLIVDHWPEDRATRLATLILEKCRYKHRVRQLLSEVVYHRDQLSRGMEKIIRSLGQSFSKSDDPARQFLGTEMLRILEPTAPGEYRWHPRLKRLRTRQPR